MPDYRTLYDAETDQVSFYPKNTKELVARLSGQ